MPRSAGRLGGTSTSLGAGAVSGGIGGPCSAGMGGPFILLFRTPSPNSGSYSGPFILVLRDVLSNPQGSPSAVGRSCVLKFCSLGQANIGFVSGAGVVSAASARPIGLKSDNDIARFSAGAFAIILLSSATRDVIGSKAPEGSLGLIRFKLLPDGIGRDALAIRTD